MQNEIAVFISKELLKVFSLFPTVFFFFFFVFFALTKFSPGGARLHRLYTEITMVSPHIKKNLKKLWRNSVFCKDSTLTVRSVCG